MNKIYLLTKNTCKLKSAQSVFSRYGIEVNMIKRDFPEIQGDTSLEVATHAAINAAKELNLPIVREDHSLFIGDLGFPGPYTNYFEKRLSAEKLISFLGEKKYGYFELGTVYADPRGTVKKFVDRIQIKISRIPKGKKGNWDRVLMLRNSTKTFSECEEGENNHIWGKNFEKVADFIRGENEKRF